MLRAAWSLVALLTASCSTSVPAAKTTTTSAEQRDDAVTRLTRERDDALRRATAAESVSTKSRHECETATQDLAKLRERDNFEQSIWIRLDQADLSVHSLGDLLPQLSREQRKNVEKAIHESLPLRGEVERQLRRLHAVPDSEWPQFERELDKQMDALEDALHPLL
jgi:hypothetical protein